MYNLLLIQKQKDEEIASLDTLIKSNPDPRELKRALAVKMAMEGQTSKKNITTIRRKSIFCFRLEKGF
jgi:hypothetical protein